MILRRWLPVLLIAAALIPSALFAWRYRDMPYLGRWHDDTVYLVTAKSLAEGHGYKLLNLPGEPPQTKYPPGYPAYLAFIWSLAPEFPASIPWLMLASWLWLPLLLAVMWKLYSLWDLPPAVKTPLLVFSALSVYLTTFACSLLSELPFTVLLVATLVLAEAAGSAGKRSLWVFAGIVGGVAFLVRSAAIPLVIAIPAAEWLRRRNWQGLIFSASMLPVMAVWMWWSSSQRVAGTDYVVIYYTDYFRDLVLNIDFTNFHVFLWRNVDSWMSGVGTSVFLLYADKGMVMRSVLYVIAALAMVGAVRFSLAVRAALPYGLFAAMYVVMVLIWCYPPNERFVIPVFPLLLAGFFWEGRRIVSAVVVKPWRHPEGAIGRLVIGLVALVFGWHVVHAWREMPEFYAVYAPLIRGNAACMDTLRKLPSAGSVLSRFDGRIFLLTGKQAFGPFLPPRLIYEERDDERTRLLSDPSVFAKTYPVGYLFYNTEFEDMGSDENIRRIEHAWNTNPRMELIATCGNGRLWRVR